MTGPATAVGRGRGGVLSRLRTALRASVRRRRDDAGVSVAELAITAAIGSMVLAGVATVAVGALDSVREIGVRSGNSADARIAGEVLTRSLRTAVRPKGVTAALASAGDSTVSFYALLNRSGTAQTTDTVPSYVELGWNGTCLTRRITPGVAVASPPVSGPDYTWTPSDTAVCVARSTTAPVYSYYATAAISVNGTDTTPLALSGGALPSTDLRSVQAVEVRFTVTDPSRPTVPGTPVVSRVTLTNVLTDSGGA